MHWINRQCARESGAALPGDDVIRMEIIMKKFILLVTTALMLAAAHTASAEQLAYFNTSAAGSVSGTGFSVGAPIPDDAVYKIVTDETGANSLFLQGSASSSNTIVMYDTSWSANSVDHLIMTTRVKTDEVDSTATKSYTFRMSAAPHYTVLNIKGDKFQCCGATVPGITVEAGRWYDIKVALKKYPSYMIELYIDGVKVSTQSSPNLSKMTATGLQFRVEVLGYGTMYVGDTEIYVPDTPYAQMENDQLSDIGEPVEIDLISSEIDEDTVLAENITVTDNFSGDKVDFDMERTDGGIEFTFPQGIKAYNSYTVNLGGIIDKSGQQFNEITFYTPKPDSDYKIGDIKLYSGFGANNEISALRTGSITVGVPVANGGLQTRSISLVCALYQDSELVGVSTAGLALGEEEESELYTSLYLDKVNSGTKLYVMLWDGFIGTPVTGRTVFSN